MTGNNNTKGNTMNAASTKLTKAETKLVNTLQAYADTLDICDCGVVIDNGTVYMCRTIRGYEGAKFHNVGGTNHPVEWIQARMKAIESEIE
jgi:hypothetical protein